MSNIQIPSEFTEVVKERLKIVSDYDQSQSHAARLRVLSSKTDKVDSPEPIDALIDKESPPKELGAAVISLEKKLAEIDQLQEAINKSRLKIEEIEARFKQIVIGVAIASITVLLILLLVIFG